MTSFHDRRFVFVSAAWLSLGTALAACVGDDGDLVGTGAGTLDASAGNDAAPDAPPVKTDGGGGPDGDAGGQDSGKPEGGADVGTLTHSVGGSVSGLTGTLILQNNGGDDLGIAADGTFTFAKEIASGGAYAVSVLQQPAGQTCAVANGSGTMGAADVANVSVTCVTNGFLVGGTVTGMKGMGPMILRNNGGDDLSIAGDGSFTFATPVPTGSAYAVTISGQPTGNVCSVAQGSGTVATAAVSDVLIECTSYRAIVLASTPVAYWKLDEAAGAIASQVGAFSAAKQGTVTFGADGIVKPEPAVGLATDGYFEVPYDAAWNPSGDFSLEAWIRVAKSTGDYQAILTSRNGGTGVTRTGWTLYVNPTLKPELWQGTDTFWSIIGGPNALVLDTSYHVVATFEGTTSGTQALYVNGAEVASAPVAAFGGNPSKPLRIGAGVTESATASFFFNGTIDEIALYARTLTPAEITEHFTVGSTQR